MIQLSAFSLKKNYFLFGCHEPLLPPGLSSGCRKWRALQLQGGRLIAGLSSCSVRSRACEPLSCSMRARQLQTAGHGPSRCCTRAQVLLGTWDPPAPGIEATCPALAGRFFSTEPPGKSSILFLKAELTSQKRKVVGFFFFLIVRV